MFDYIVDKIKDTEFSEVFENKVKYIELQNFFTQDHLKKLTNDVYNNKHLTMKDWPVDGTDPSLISFADMVDNDKTGFYEPMYDFFSSKEIKSAILKKFGLNKNIEEVQYRMSTSISFHTEYPQQIDYSHSDQKDNLFTISLQIYLPQDDSLKDYGTLFHDSSGKEIYRTNFLSNTGYCFLATNNSWHKPVTGVERKSFFVRYSYNLNIEKTQTIFNYNPKNKICHLIWNKDMGIYPRHTDWMAIATLQNTSKLNVENIAVTKEPFKRDIEVFRDLKDQGYEKVIVYFGGMIWHDNSFFDYVRNYDMKEMIIGSLKKNNQEFLRQFFAINLNRLDDMYETHARGNFFEEVISDKDYVNVAGQRHIFPRSYYHPEEEHGDYIANFIKNNITDLPPNFLEEIGHLQPFKSDNSTLLHLLQKIRQF